MPFFETFLSLLFPDSCVGCSSRGSLLCDACRKKLPPAPSAREHFIASAYAYADPRVRRLVKLLKYKNTRHAARIFGRSLAGMLAEFIGEDALFIGGRTVLIVPVPLSKKRKKLRGYNQAELLAKAMLEEFGNGAGSGQSETKIISDTKLLEKRLDTAPQAEITKRSERLSNLGDCFRVAEGRASRGEIVILVDDVTTTGATLLACRKALGRRGFAQVHAFTAAH